MAIHRRSLHWERGLKLLFRVAQRGRKSSLPSLGAWIETPDGHILTQIPTGSLPSLGAWIETGGGTVSGGSCKGRSLHWERGLKLLHVNCKGMLIEVAPFIGSVD